MKNTNTNIESLHLSPEVNQALGQYNSTINRALDAVQKLESISITAHLAELFGTKETKTAQVLQKDYLVTG